MAKGDALGRHDAGCCARGVPQPQMVLNMCAGWCCLWSTSELIMGCLPAAAAWLTCAPGVQVPEVEAFKEFLRSCKHWAYVFKLIQRQSPAKFSRHWYFLGVTKGLFRSKWRNGL